MSRRNINGMSGFQANRIKSKMMRSHHCSTTAQKHAYPLFASENMGVLTPDGCAEMFWSCFCRRGCQTDCDGYIRVLHVFLQGRAIVSCELCMFCHLQKSFSFLCLPTLGCMFFSGRIVSQMHMLRGIRSWNVCFLFLKVSFWGSVSKCGWPVSILCNGLPVLLLHCFVQNGLRFSTVFGVGLCATSWNLDLSFARYLQHFAVRTSNGNGNCIMMESGFCACIVSTPCLAFRCFTRMELATFRIMAGKFLQTCVFKIAPKNTIETRMPKTKNTQNHKENNWENAKRCDWQWRKYGNP